jgi:hypothetical protein
MRLEISSKGERELPLGRVASQVKESLWDNFPSVVKGKKLFKILPDNGTKILLHR